MEACWGPAAYGYTASITGITLGQSSSTKTMKFDTATNPAALIGVMKRLSMVLSISIF